MILHIFMTTIMPILVMAVAGFVLVLDSILRARDNYHLVMQ